MGIQKFNGLVLLEEEGLFGEIVGVNFISGEMIVAVETDEGAEIFEGVKEENVRFLEYVASIGEVQLVSGDVLAVDGQMNEIEQLEDGNVVIHLLDDNLKRIKTTPVITTEQFEEMLKDILEKRDVELLGNILLNEVDNNALDFNIKIVKSQTVEGLQYLYACNNKTEEEVDLINIVFIGATFIEEEDYSRETVSHEDFLALIEDGHLIEVGEQEFKNYVLGVMHGRKPTAQPTQKGICEGGTCDCIEHCEIEDEEICDNCNNHIEDCDCFE